MRRHDFIMFTGASLLAAILFPAASRAQQTIDRVTGFAREPIHVAAWP
jgi:allantoinase